MEKWIDRRLYERIPLRTRCHLKIIAGGTFPGYTRDIGLHGVFMESSSFSVEKHKPPKAGDTGVLTLYDNVPGTDVYLKLPCQIAHARSSGIGLNVRYMDLTKKDKEIFESILDHAVTL